MRIVADADIVSLKPFLADLAELHLLPGRQITRDDLLKADVLLVRSITRVDEELLHGTPVKFVGSATSGTDHIDQNYLRSAKIQFADARGSNANAVVDYCFAALAFASVCRNLYLDSCKVGLIGAGHVGGLFAHKLEVLGIPYQVYDPPLQEILGSGSLASPVCYAVSASESRVQGRAVPPLARFCSLDELLQCNVVSLHVPLVMSGEDSTYNMIGERELGLLPPGAVLVNTCRGSVVHEPALLERLLSDSNLTYIADVWSNEPQVDLNLLASASIATPHIAGYSRDAKQNATQMLLARLAACFHWPEFATGQVDTQIQQLELSVMSSADSHWRCLLELLPLPELDREFRQQAQQGGVAAQFDILRKRLLSRREFKYCQVSGANFTDRQKTFLQVQGLQLI